MIFEMDVKYVVDIFNNNQLDLSPFGAILQDCKFLFNSFFPNSTIEFTRRDANVVARNLVWVATCMASPQNFDVCLDCIVGLILNEML